MTLKEIGFDIQCMVCGLGLGFYVVLPLSISFFDVLTVTNCILVFPAKSLDKEYIEHHSLLG